MRSSSLVLFGAAGLLLVSASACRIEAHTQTQFEDSTQPGKTSTKDWNGESISIQNDGINPLGGRGGVEVKFSATATKISADAIFAAHADDDKKSDADLTIKEAIGTLVIEESGNGFTVKCGHGNSHGSASQAGSGCKLIHVTIPPGSATQPHDLTVGSGNGDIRIGLANAGDVPFIKNLLVDDNGAGDVDIRVRPVKDAVLVVTGEFKVQVALPANFSAGKVLFTTNDSDPVKANARVHVPGFAGMVSGSAYPVAGATADAAATLNVQSKGILDSDTVTINAFQ